MTNLDRSKNDFDGAWKHALIKFLPDVFRLLFPEAHARIDWARGFEFKDNELATAVRGSKFSKLRVDKLVQVYLLEGGKLWILIHIEVQNQRDSNFALRMYVYNYRIFDLHKVHAASFGVLGDDSASWRPCQYAFEQLGTRSDFQYPIVKLKDFENRIDELESSDNPFALVVLAHLRTLASRNSVERRAEFKRRLFRLAYGSGFSKTEIVELLSAINWMMQVPPAIQDSLDVELTALEKEKPVGYIHSFEREAEKKGIEKGLRESILSALRTRFGKVPAEMKDVIMATDVLTVLRAMHKRAIMCKSVEDFSHFIHAAK